MFNLVLLLGSLRLASANTWPWSPPEEPRTVHLTQHLVQISHLSPLLHYTPVDAWTFTAQGAFTDQPGANVSLHYMGSQLAIMGYRSGAVDLDISPLVPERYPGTEEDNYRFVPPGSTSGVLLHMNGGGNVTYERRLVSFQLPKVEEGEEEDSPFAPLTVQGVRMSSVLPSDWHVNEEPHSDNLHLEVAVHDDGMNAFFQSTPETWTIETSSPPSDDFTLVPGPGGAYEAGLSGTTWPRSVLSTSTHFASLTFDVPERASILQLYGNVGPNLGKARLIIEANPESPTPVNFHDDSMTGIVIDAERPMEASGQLLGLVWLDPRTRYKAVLSLDDVRPGKAFQLAGVTTKQYIADGGSVQGDWLAEWNKEFGTRWTPPPPPPPPSRPARPSRSRSPPPQRHNATPVPSSVDENPKKEIPGIPLEYTAYGWYLLIIPVLCLYWLFSRASRSSDPAEKQPIMSAIDTSVASVVPSRLTYGSYDEEALRSARMARRPDSSARAPTPRSPISVGITSPSGRVSVPPPAYVARGRA